MSATLTASPGGTDIQYLCCPYPDHGDLKQISANEIVCEICNRSFRSAEGRPILFDESKSIFTSTEVASLGDMRQFPENKGWRYRVRKLFPASSSREICLSLFEKFSHLLPCSPVVLVIGCGFSGERYVRAFSKGRVFLSDVTLQGDSTVVCDAECLPFRDQSLDCVVIDQVLEHALNPVGVVADILRCLRSGGIVYSGLPFHTPIHGFPFDFNRYTPLGHRMLFRGFEELEMRITQGPVSALSLTLIGFLSGLWDNRWWKSLCSLAVRISFTPIFWLDLRYAKSSNLTIPAASAFFGRKQSDEVHPRRIVSDWASMCQSKANKPTDWAERV